MTISNRFEQVPTNLDKLRRVWTSFRKILGNAQWLSSKSSCASRKLKNLLYLFQPGEYGVKIVFTEPVANGILLIKSKSSSKTGAPIELKTCKWKLDKNGAKLFFAEVVKGASIVRGAVVV